MSWDHDSLRELITYSYPSALTRHDDHEYYEVYTLGGVDEITDTSLGYAILDSRPLQGSLAFAPPDTLQQQWETHAIDALTYRNDYVRFLRESYHRYREMWVAFFKVQRLVIACSCKDGEICHRDILADAFVRLHHRAGHEADYLGDIRHVDLSSLYRPTHQPSGGDESGHSGSGCHSDDWE